MKINDIQIINTITPKGEDDKYTVNFTMQTDEISLSGRVQFTQDEFEDFTEKQKPQAVLEKMNAKLGDINE